MKVQRYDAEKVESDVCLSSDVEQLEARLERAEQLNAELLSAAKAAEAALRNYDIAGEFGWGSCRTPSQMEEQCAWSEEVYILRAAIAKAERSEDEPITDDEGAL
jgi:hypothetical protein